MLTMLGILCLGLGTLSKPASQHIPDGTIPSGLGVNIHFTDPKPGEMEMLAAAGFRWVRMDFDWIPVEYERGKYRFDAYDRLMSALDKHGIRALFILDYVHPLYDNAQSPHTDEGIQAFARFAAAAAAHYRGRRILWEMYNEPNIYPFWRPKPNVNDYIRLATAVGKAIREAAPGSGYVGPATSGIDMPFLEACFKAGLLEYWDAVTVHPYRSQPPETVLPDYLRLRELIRRYAPKGKNVPIVSGEWGYSAVWAGMDADKQGKYLARQWLTNISADIPLSIWYDWHDDGPDPKEPEHHFGTVRHPYREGQTPVYEPKPAYHAAQTLIRELDGFRFSKRLMVGDAQHFVLLFRKGREVRIAAWTTRQEGAEVVIPASPGRFEAVNHLGEPLPPLEASGQGLKVRLSDAPIYLRPQTPNAVLTIAAAWERLPLDVPTQYRSRVTVRAVLQNPTNRPIRVDDGVASTIVRPGARCEVSRQVPLQRTQQPIPVRLSVRVDGSAPLIQETHVVVSNPLTLQVQPPYGGQVAVTLASPTGSPFQGAVEVEARSGEHVRKETRPVMLTATDMERTVVFPAPDAGEETTVTCTVRDTKRTVVLAQGPRRFRVVAPFANPESVRLSVVPDGDPRVKSEQSLAVEAPPSGPPIPGIPCYRLKYRFEGGWKFVRIVGSPAEALTIEGRPAAVGLWIYGDGQGNIPRLRFADATNQTFQPDGDPVTWKGWRYVVYAMDGTRSGHWGGAGDGVIHYPIRWDSVFLLDSAGGKATEGEVWVAGLTLIYDN